MSETQSFGNVEHFVKAVAVVEIAIIILYGETTVYASPGDVSLYAMYQDIHVMMFIGFGFLMTFLRRYGFSALTYNFMIASFSIQWGGWLIHYFANVWKGAIPATPVALDLTFLTDGDIAAAVVLISFGAVLGRTTPFQLLLMAIFELVVYAWNFHLVTGTIGVIDVGGSIVVHTFGAYFGLAVAYVLGAPENHRENKSIYHSDFFSMIGTLFLWVFWPSFNGYFATVADGGWTRAVVNTVLSLCASVMMAMVTSAFISEEGEFDMVHIQNSTLAGGVAAGAAADLSMKPAGALATGVFAGILSVWGYASLSPYLEYAYGLWDTCGVHNLHGMPGVAGGIVSFIVLAGLNDMTQAWKQLAGLGVTLVIAIFSGLFFGGILRSMEIVAVFYDDAQYFSVPQDSTKDFFAATIRGAAAFGQLLPGDDANVKPSGLDRLRTLSADIDFQPDDQKDDRADLYES